MSVKKEITHCDRLGKNLEVGDVVAFSHDKTLKIGSISKLHPVLVEIKELDSRPYWNPPKVYPSMTIKLEGPEITAYLLKVNIK